MSVIGTGFSPAGPFKAIDRSLWPEMMKEMRLEENQLLEEPKAPITLMVELPFWLLCNPSSFDLTHSGCKLKAHLFQNLIAFYHGPHYLSSQVNVAYVLTSQRLDSDDVPEYVKAIPCPITRQMKSTICFEALAPPSLFAAVAEKQDIKAGEHSRIRHVNRGLQYFHTLASAHIPFLNHLIASYRSDTYDPFAYEISEWDIPIWFFNREDRFVPICLMPYALNDDFPTLNFLHNGVRPYLATSSANIQMRCGRNIPSGKHELLDAKSLLYRGRYADSIRSAVTAIEVAVEQKLIGILKTSGLTPEQCRDKLSETQNSFFERVLLLEKLSGVRVPGPIVSDLPHLNGLRLKQELSWVRDVRHDIVHRGMRFDLTSKGMATRAVETMTWLFLSLGIDDPNSNESKNYAWYGSMLGISRYSASYLKNEIAVSSNTSEEAFQEPIRTIDDIIDDQYRLSITKSDCDIEHFVAMSLSFLDISWTDAPFNEAPKHYGRFIAEYKSNRATVHCINVPGLLSVDNAKSILAFIDANLKSESQSGRSFLVVNHDCSLPLARRRENPFEANVEEILTEGGVTITSAKDLYRFVSGVAAYNWEVDYEAIFKQGRQFVTPSHYKLIGSVNVYYPRLEVMSLDVLDGSSIRANDKLSLCLADGFFEMTVETMQVDHNPLEEVLGPCRVGIKVAGQRGLNKGVRAFLVDKSHVSRGSGESPGV